MLRKKKKNSTQLTRPLRCGWHGIDDRLESYQHFKWILATWSGVWFAADFPCPANNRHRFKCESAAFGRSPQRFCFVGHVFAGCFRLSESRFDHGSRQNIAKRTHNWISLHADLFRRTHRGFNIIHIGVFNGQSTEMGAALEATARSWRPQSLHAPPLRPDAYKHQHFNHHCRFTGIDLAHQFQSRRHLTYYFVPECCRNCGCICPRIANGSKWEPSTCKARADEPRSIYTGFLRRFHAGLLHFFDLVCVREHSSHHRRSGTAHGNNWGRLHWPDHEMEEELFVSFGTDWRNRWVFRTSAAH